MPHNQTLLRKCYEPKAARCDRRGEATCRALGGVGVQADQVYPDHHRRIGRFRSIGESVRAPLVERDMARRYPIAEEKMWCPGMFRSKDWWSFWICLFFVAMALSQPQHAWVFRTVAVYLLFWPLVYTLYRKDCKLIREWAQHWPRTSPSAVFPHPSPQAAPLGHSPSCRS